MFKLFLVSEFVGLQMRHRFHFHLPIFLQNLCTRLNKVFGDPRNNKRIMTDKRVTMIKPVVGKVKSPSYALPGNDFVYGIESKLDKECAGQGELCSFIFHPCLLVSELWRELIYIPSLCSDTPQT